MSSEMLNCINYQTVTTVSKNCTASENQVNIFHSAWCNIPENLLFNKSLLWPVWRPRFLYWVWRLDVLACQEPCHIKITLHNLLIRANFITSEICHPVSHEQACVPHSLWGTQVAAFS